MIRPSDDDAPPPVAPLFERARRLVEDIELGVRGDWRDGEGVAAADELAERPYNRIAADLEPCRNPFGQQYAAQYVGRMGHVRRGSTTGATPHGRLAGLSVCERIAEAVFLPLSPGGASRI